MGVGFGEILIIIVIALIFLSPDKIPEVVHSLGKAFNDIKKVGREFKAVILEEVKKEKEEKKEP
ncbi:MAG: twin-arginine translocase TatA/TatE family subunit [Deltaproteobacteria bacterium]|nr:twin-arginine translocase TatA/TatE family subunit [Deltaproteobacteria bacterium]